jgi:hypothetical protein
MINKALYLELKIQTLEGALEVKPGYWICRGIEQELWTQSEADLLKKYHPTNTFDGTFRCKAFNESPTNFRCRICMLLFSFAAYIATQKCLFLGWCRKVAQIRTETRHSRFVLWLCVHHTLHDWLIQFSLHRSWSCQNHTSILCEDPIWYIERKSRRLSSQDLGSEWSNFLKLTFSF